MPEIVVFLNLARMVRTFRRNAPTLLVFLFATFAVPSLGWSASGEVLIRQGVELRRQGKDAAAAERFEAAYKELQTPRAAAQLGLCEQALGRWLPAELHLRESLTAESDPWIRRNRKTLEQALLTVRGELAQLVVEGTPESATVTWGDEPLGALAEREFWVLPGQGELRVSAPGHQGEARALSLTAGQRLSLSVSLLLEDATRELTSPADSVSALATPNSAGVALEDTSSSRKENTWMWIGGGAILAVVAGTLAVVLLSGVKDAAFDERRSVRF